MWRREGRLNVDFLDTLAIAASLMQGNPMAGAIVTWLIKLGDWIRDLTAAGSKRAISELLEFQIKTAWVMRDGVVTSIPATELAVGDAVVAYPGEIIPVDGEIIDGHAMIDQKTITGEGLPVMRASLRLRVTHFPPASGRSSRRARNRSQSAIPRRPSERGAQFVR